MKARQADSERPRDRAPAHQNSWTARGVHTCDFSDRCRRRSTGTESKAIRGVLVCGTGFIPAPAIRSFNSKVSGLFKIRRIHQAETCFARNETENVQLRRRSFCTSDHSRSLHESYNWFSGLCGIFPQSIRPAGRNLHTKQNTITGNFHNNHPQNE